MGLNKIKIGSLVEPVSIKCGIPQYENVSGINIYKRFMPSRNIGADTSNYLIVPPGHFAFNLMHVGRDEKIPVAINNTEENVVVSGAYFAFKVIDEETLLKEYLNIIMTSPEFDRYAWFCTDSSIRGNLDWGRFCEIEIDLPPFPIQQKYVDVYNAMLANQRAYECGLEDLKLTYQALIEDLRRKLPTERIGAYIEPRREKNTDCSIALEQGINIDKQFITPQRSNANLSSRVIVRTGQIAYCTQLNNENVAIAYRTGCDCVVSPVYDVFEVTKKDKLLPEYLMTWLIRTEFGRYVYWASEGSAYEFLRFENICDFQIPIPEIKTQQSIVDIYNAYIIRRGINEKLKAQIKDICPILIKGSIEEAKRVPLKAGATWN